MSTAINEFKTDKKSFKKPNLKSSDLPYGFRTSEK